MAKTGEKKREQEREGKKLFFSFQTVKGQQSRKAGASNFVIKRKNTCPFILSTMIPLNTAASQSLMPAITGAVHAALHCTLVLLLRSIQEIYFKIQHWKASRKHSSTKPSKKHRPTSCTAIFLASKTSTALPEPRVYQCIKWGGRRRGREEEKRRLL